MVNMTLPEQAVVNALRGHNSENAKQPSPRLVKIYVSSTKNGKILWKLYVCDFVIL